MKKQKNLLGSYFAFYGIEYFEILGNIFLKTIKTEEATN